MTAAASRRSSSTTSTRTGTVSPKAGHARITLSAPSQPACGTVIVRAAWTTGGGSKERVRSMGVTLSRRGRWAVPVIAVAVTGGVIAGTQIPVSAGIPCAAGRTPGAAARRRSARTRRLPPLTGTVVETASLGLPQLPQAGNPTSLSSLLTGSHTIKVYYRTRKHFRLAVPQPMSETDVIVNGDHAVALGEHRQLGHRVHRAYDSARARPEDQAARRPGAHPAAGRQRDARGRSARPPWSACRPTSTVAGEPAYQLVLEPKDRRSLVGQVRDRGRRQVRHAAAGPGLREGRGRPGVPGRLHPLSSTPPPAAGELQLHPAAGRVRWTRSTSGDKAAAKPAARARRRPGAMSAPTALSWLTVVVAAAAGPHAATRNGRSRL